MKFKHIQNGLRFALAASAAVMPVHTIPVSAETVSFEKNAYTYFLQNDQLNEGWSIHEGIFSVSGRAAYCIEPKETVVIGSDSYETSSWQAYSGYSESLKNTILEYSYFGYGFKNRTDMEYWYATQILIWQAINPAFASTRVYRDDAYTGNGMRSAKTVEITDSISAKKKEIEDEVNAYHARLNLTVTGSNGNTLSQPYTAKAGETITVSGEGLASWQPSENPEGFIRKGNTMSFTRKTAGEISLTLRYGGTAEAIESAPLVLKAKDGSKIQTLIIHGKADTRTIPLRFSFTDLSLKIRKTDQDGRNKPLGNASLKDAVYELFNVSENREAGQFVTDEDGVSNTIGGLNLCDTYRLKEINAPAGFVKDMQIYEFRLDQLKEENGIYEIQVKDQIIKGRIGVHKVITSRFSSGPVQDEKGAQFVIVPQAFYEKYKTADKALAHTDELSEYEYSKIVTDEKGYGESTDLVYGTYMVIQTAAISPELEFCQPFTVSVDGSEPSVKVYELSNIQNEYELKIIKSDQASGKKITVHSAAFQIFDEKGQLVKLKAGASYYDTFMTASDNPPKNLPANVWLEKASEKGTVVLPAALRAGSYTIKETQAPEGYALKNEDVTIVIGAASLAEAGSRLVEANVTDEKESGSLKLHKSIVHASCDKSLIAQNDLSGFVFAVYADEEIRSMDDGSSVLSKDSEYARLTTGPEGTASLEGMPFGAYRLVEISAPAGVILSEEPIHFEINGKTKEISLEIENSTVITRFSKKAASGAEELPGAKLSVRKEDGSVVDEWISGSSPHVIEGLDPALTYILKEEITPRDASGNDAGYVKAEEIRFQPDAVKEGSVVTMKDQMLLVEKKDENGKPLAGAVLQAVGEDGTVLDEWTSDTAPHAVKGIEQGVPFILREKEAPQGWYRCADMKITVSPNDGDRLITLTDSLIRVRVCKTDEKTGKDLSGVTLSLYEVNDEKEELIETWVSDGTPKAFDGILKAGGSYRLEETETVNGVYKAADMYFRIDEIDPQEEEPLTVIMIDADVETAAAKTDGQGKYLAGAHLCVRDEAGNIMHEWISSEEGPEDLSPYLKGGQRYILEETEAPEGYALMDAVAFTVSGSSERHQTVRAVNRPQKIRLEVFKTAAEDGKPLEGAVFSVYRVKDNTQALTAEGEKAEITTGADGRGNVFLPYESSGYYVLETKAPSGYRINRSRFAVSKEADSSVPVINLVIEVSDEKKTVETGIASSRGKLLMILSGVLLCGLLFSSKRRFS